MEQAPVSTYDQIIQLATDLLNAVRGFLAHQLNIDLPMWVAQAIVLALFVPILWYSVRAVRKARRPAKKVAPWAACIVTGVVSLVILATWVSYWRSPLLEQLEGEVTGLKPNVELQSLHVDLLDFRGESLGPRVHWLSNSTRFLLSYSPEFADPPRMIRVAGGGCKCERHPRRRELTQAMVMAVALDCSGAP
jgi:hypothetical protein